MTLYEPHRSGEEAAARSRPRSKLGLRSRVLAIGALCIVGACRPASWAPEAVPSSRISATRRALEDLEPVPAGSLRVALAFSRRADLDLRVKGPKREVVHYAHPRAASGLVFLEDRLCGDPAPRIERVEADPAPPGRYGIGIEFRQACDPRDGEDAPAKTVRWQLRVDRGAEVEWLTGSIAAGVFEPEIHVFEID